MIRKQKRFVVHLWTRCNSDAERKIGWVLHFYHHLSRKVPGKSRNRGFVDCGVAERLLKLVRILCEQHARKVKNWSFQIIMITLSHHGGDASQRSGESSLCAVLVSNIGYYSVNPQHPKSCPPCHWYITRPHSPQMYIADCLWFPRPTQTWLRRRWMTLTCDCEDGVIGGGSSPPEIGVGIKNLPENEENTDGDDEDEKKHRTFHCYLRPVRGFCRGFFLHNRDRSLLQQTFFFGYATTCQLNFYHWASWQLAAGNFQKRGSYLRTKHHSECIHHHSSLESERERLSMRLLWFWGQDVCNFGSVSEYALNRTAYFCGSSSGSRKYRTGHT